MQDNILPNSLTHLTFGYCFNKKIRENVLPKLLNHLFFCSHENVKKNILPFSVIDSLWHEHDFQKEKHFQCNIIDIFNDGIYLTTARLKLEFFTNY